MSWEKNFPEIQCEEIVHIKAEGSHLMGVSDATFSIQLKGVSNCDKIFKALSESGYRHDNQRDPEEVLGALCKRLGLDDLNAGSEEETIERIAKRFEDLRTDLDWATFALGFRLVEIPATIHGEAREIRKKWGLP